MSQKDMNCVTSPTNDSSEGSFISGRSTPDKGAVRVNTTDEIMTPQDKKSLTNHDKELTNNTVTTQSPDSSPACAKIDTIKSDLNYKFAADEEIGVKGDDDSDVNSRNFGKDSSTLTSTPRSRKWGYLCFVIALLIVGAIVATAVLLTYDRGTSTSSNGVQGDDGSVAVTPSSPTVATPSTPVSTPTSPPVPGSTPAPTTAIPTAAPTLGIRNELLTILSNNQIMVNDQDPKSPSSMAATWMAVEAQDSPNDLLTMEPTKLIQRFSLLVLDFGLQGDAESETTEGPTSSLVIIPAFDDSNSNSTSAPTTASDSSGNETFFETPTTTNNTTSTTSSTSNTFTNPNAVFGGARQLEGMMAIDAQIAITNIDECYWPGIGCDDNGTVTNITWGNQGFVGTIPSEIGYFSNLIHLDLSQNTLQGRIPEELYGLVDLVELYLYKNQLTGTISASAGNWWNLRHLHLSHNRLTGPIPASLASSASEIRAFHYVNFKSNKLTGTIPSSLRWRQLFFLDLGDNQLTGQLPEDLGETFGSLRHLHLDHNQFVGTFPSSYITVGNGRLEQLSINDNDLTGAVPENYEFFNKLVMFTMEDNNFNQWLDSTCRLAVFQGGENVEIKADCDICACKGEPFFCQNC